MQIHQNSSDPVATIGIDTGKNTSDRLVAGQARLRTCCAPSGPIWLKSAKSKSRTAVPIRGRPASVFGPV